MSLVTSTPTKQLFRRRHRLPAKLREQPDGGLLDKLVLGVGVGAHVLGVNPFSNSATDGTAPLSALGNDSTSLVT